MKNVKIEFNLPIVVYLGDLELRKIPDYLNAYASNLGEIFLLNSKGLFSKAKVVKWKSTKGTYFYAKVINDDFLTVQKAVHKLVCISFHGKPPEDGKSYEPNHKDGNKHNNSSNNLEWITRKENIQHAFDSGLCTGGLRITVKNILNDETSSYNSLSKLAREWGIERYKLREIIASHRDIPYKNQFVFEIDDSSDKKINRHQRISIVFKNYLNNQIFITNDVVEASVLTKIKAGTIQSRVSINSRHKNRLSLLSGYVFKNILDKTPWPDYTEQEVLDSINFYKNKFNTTCS